MPRSRNVYRVTKRVAIEQPNDSTAFAAVGEIDIATLLSQKLGRTIKQNKSFRIVGHGAVLHSKIDEDLDTGFACSVMYNYIPVTKHSVKAHQMLQKTYWKQSNFRKGLGVNSKFDEFEIAMTDLGIDDRTSEVYVGGINDPLAEKCIFYGGYDDEDGAGQGYIAAEALYNAKFPVDAAGTLVEQDLLFDDQVNYKPAKFSSHIPRFGKLFSHATLSSRTFHDPDLLFDDQWLEGAVANSSMTYLPSDNHINALCGRIRYDVSVVAPDDFDIVADTLYLVMAFDIEGWSSLGSPPKRKPKRKSTYRRRYYRRGRKR